MPTTRQDERRYLAKTVELAQRCGALNGELLAHISTADTARDLDYLRQLVGDRQLTYFGGVIRDPDRPDLRQPVPPPGARHGP